MIHPAPKAARKRKPAPALRIYGPKAFRDWLHAQPCLWCGATRPIEQAHVGKHGTGKKNDWTRTIPLCGAFTVGEYRYVGCHNRLDRRRCPSATWFTAAERHTLELRLIAFHADYASQGEIV